MTDINKSEKFWNRTAESYDREEASEEPTRNKIIEKVREYLKNSDIVLDFGCGTGAFCNEIANKVKRIHAIDTSSKMIKIAKNKANDGKIENIDFFHSTIDGENFKKSSYDVILTFYLMHLLGDINKDIQRINELLKPGGTFISVTPCIGEKNRLIKFSFSLMGKIGLTPIISSFKINELEEIITKGKFEIIESEPIGKKLVEYLVIAKKL